MLWNKTTNDASNHQYVNGFAWSRWWWRWCWSGMMIARRSRLLSVVSHSSLLSWMTLLLNPM